MPFIISQNQSASIPERLITNNILIAFEALHTMDGRMKGQTGFMALKLNMSKAFDIIEWDYLEAIMRKLGFGREVDFLGHVVCLNCFLFNSG